MPLEVSTISFTDKNASQKLVDSLKNSGFAIIKNHPISHHLIDAAYSDWLNFFCGKNKFDYIFNKDTQDGYFPYLTENAKNSNTKDLKEFYHFYEWGRIPSDIGPSSLILYRKILSLTSILLSWIDDKTPKNISTKFSLPLNEMVEKSNSNLLRIIHYPPLDDFNNKSIRAAAHEDINLITALVAGTQPGLQVNDTNGDWHNISCEKNSIVVNSGDMLKMASNGYYPSTTHRVINPARSFNESRYSMPMFMHPRSNVKLNDSYTAGEYLKERLEEIGLS